MIQHNKYPLLIIFIIQFIGLMVFAVDKVQEILPAGNNNILDTLYSNPNIVYFVYYFISIIGILSLLFRKDNRKKLILICISIIILAWLQQMWFALLIYPMLIKNASTDFDIINNDPYSEFKNIPFLHRCCCFLLDLL